MDIAASFSLLDKKCDMDIRKDLHPGFPAHLPADLDQQGGVRRVRPQHYFQTDGQYPPPKHTLLKTQTTGSAYM